MGLSWTSVFACSLSLFAFTSNALSAPLPKDQTLETIKSSVVTHKERSVLLDDFLTALDAYSNGASTISDNPMVRRWGEEFTKKKVDPEFVAQRSAKMKARSNADAFAQYRNIEIETYPRIKHLSFAANAAPEMALHFFRLDVIEEFDDVTNDDLYAYFVVTHDDLVWAKVTSIYKGLDEGDSAIITGEDRGLFGPNGRKLPPKNHVIVDLGIVESDGDDIAQLKKLSDAIIDLAVVALSVYNPDAGIAAEKARSEVKNLMRVIIELDNDDRLVTKTLHYSPEQWVTALGSNSYTEFSERFEERTSWSHFNYRLNFRLLR